RSASHAASSGLEPLSGLSSSQGKSSAVAPAASAVAATKDVATASARRRRTSTRKRTGKDRPAARSATSDSETSSAAIFSSIPPFRVTPSIADLLCRGRFYGRLLGRGIKLPGIGTKIAQDVDFVEGASGF